MIADTGNQASERFFTFFTDALCNKNTWATCYRNSMRYSARAETRGLALTAIKSHHISAYFEQLSVDHATLSVKQHLATLRMLFDWRILGQVLKLQPASPPTWKAHLQCGSCPAAP